MAPLELEYNIRQPLTESNAAPLIVLLHGYGADMNDLFSLASELPDEALIIAPQAPHRLPWGGYAWWNFQQSDTGVKSDFDQANRSIETLQLFLDQIEEKYSYNRNKVILLGFSQGGMISYATAFRRPEFFCGVLALSSYLMPEIMPEEEPNGSTLPPFFISHGTEDPVLSVEGAQKSRDYLLSLDAKVEYHEYPMVHGINPDNLLDARKWIDLTILK